MTVSDDVRICEMCGHGWASKMRARTDQAHASFCSNHVQAHLDPLCLDEVSIRPAVECCRVLSRGGIRVPHTLLNLKLRTGEPKAHSWHESTPVYMLACIAAWVRRPGGAYSKC